MGDSSLNTAILEKLIADAKASGGSERGTYQTFINTLCDGLGLANPDMNNEVRALNDYVYERRVNFNQQFHDQATSRKIRTIPASNHLPAFPQK